MRTFTQSNSPLPEALRPPRPEPAGPIPFVYLYDFQREVERYEEYFTSIIEENGPYVEQAWRSVAIARQGTHESQALTDPLLAQWIDKTVQFFGAQAWLQQYQVAIPLVLSVEAPEIDVTDPDVQPLWNEIAGTNKEYWGNSFRQLVYHQDWNPSATHTFDEPLSQDFEKM